jgi:hypothetical protein
LLLNFYTNNALSCCGIPTDPLLQSHDETMLATIRSLSVGCEKMNIDLPRIELLEDVALGLELLERKHLGALSTRLHEDGLVVGCVT